jgi:hypothetical protein
VLEEATVIEGHQTALPSAKQPICDSRFGTVYRSRAHSRFSVIYSELLKIPSLGQAKRAPLLEARFAHEQTRFFSNGWGVEWSGGGAMRLSEREVLRTKWGKENKTKIRRQR